MSDASRRCLEDLVRLESAVVGALDRAGESASQSLPGTWSACEHALHVILSLESVAEGFQERLDSGATDPPSSSVEKSLARRFVLTTFRIPRGRKAPPRVLPRAIFSPRELVARLRVARDAFLPLLDLADLDRDSCWLEHHELGPMSFDDWVRFLLIHALHHVRIMRRDHENTG